MALSVVDVEVVVVIAIVTMFVVVVTSRDELENDFLGNLDAVFVTSF